VPYSKANPEEDAERLFLEYKATRDPALRDRLVLMHENLVRFLAAKFANRGEPLEDLVQVGTIGLINAIDRFEPDRGTKFSTYATPTIVGEIKRHFRDRAWNLKVPRWLQELNLQVMKANEQLSQQLGRSPTIAEIAEHVGASEAETLDAMELGNAYETVSLDTKLSFEGETAPLTLNDSIGVDDTSLQKINQYDDLKAAVECLDNREKMIIYLRFFHDLSQTEVAQRLNISQMHVSRLQHKALKRLKDLMSDVDEAAGSAQASSSAPSD
jgi:RNA polymerase sigma-B factor